MVYQPINIYHEYNSDRGDCINRYISNRVLKNNKNFLCAVTGQTGVGKSWLCVALAEDLCQFNGIPFIPQKHIVSSLKQVLELINDREFSHDIQNGTPLVFEEPQMEANSRTWQQEANRMLASLLSIFREQRLIVFFSCPFIEFIDFQSRVLFHGKFEVQSFDKKTRITKVKPRFIEYSPICPNPDGFYKRRIINLFAIEGKNYYGNEKVGYISVEAPSQPMIDAYETIKKANSQRWYKQMLEKVNEAERKKVKTNPKELYNHVLKLYDEFGENFGAYLNVLPDITPPTLEKYLVYVRKSRKWGKRAVSQVDSLTQSSNTTAQSTV